MPQSISFVLTWFFIPYYLYMPAILLMVPILLFTTRRMTGRWLDGHIDRGFHLRVIGWTGIAVAAPMIVVLGLRWWTTPPVMTDWRASMIAVRLPTLDRSTMRRGDISSSPVIATSAMDRGFGVQNDIGPAIDIRLRDELEDVNAGRAIGRHVSFQELVKLFEDPSSTYELSDSGNREVVEVSPVDDTILSDDFDRVTGGNAATVKKRRRIAMEILLKWSKLVRQRVADGKEGLRELMLVAEKVEPLAMSFMNGDPLMKSEISDKPLRDFIPSTELRNRSRRVALIREWQRYNSDGWFESNPVVAQKYFADQELLSSPNHRSWIERRRADRYVDRFTRQVIEMIDTGKYGDPIMIGQIRSDLAAAQYGPRLDEQDPQLGSSQLMSWVESMQPEEWFQTIKNAQP